MDANTKLELAIDIMANKIARTSRENAADTEEKLEKLMIEREKMYRFDEETIDKIINVYGKEMKN